MRTFMLSCAALLSASFCHAQNNRAVISQNEKKVQQGGRSEIIVETGFNIATSPTLVSTNSTVEPSEQHLGVGTNLVFKFLPVARARFSLGVRLAAHSLRVSGDAYAVYTNGRREEVAAKYANPLIQIGLQGHLNVPVTPKFGLQISPYGGYGVAFSEKVDQNRTAVTAIPVGTSSGWNAGIDLSGRVHLTSQLTLTLATGYQRSWMRFSGSNQISPFANGFNISHFPFNAGLGIAL